MVGPTGEDEMCNFYMMYWVDGKDTIEPNTCFTRWKKMGNHQNSIFSQGTAYLVLGRPWPARTWRRPWKHTWPWSFRPVKDLIQVASWVPWLASISWNPAEAMHPMENHLEPISLTEKMLIGCLHSSKPVSSSAIVVTWSPKTPIELFISTSNGVV